MVIRPFTAILIAIAVLAIPAASIRVEAFNVFNRVVWDAPNTDFSSSNFGLVTKQFNAPRQMQLGLKL